MNNQDQKEISQLKSERLESIIGYKLVSNLNTRLIDKTHAVFSKLEHE